MIKNVIFDVGQVLVAWEPVEAMRALGMDEETVRAVADATVHTSDWDEADRGALSDEELLTGFIRKAPAYEAQIRNFWEHVNRAIYPFPYVGEWMRTLKDKGYRLYILSNYGKWTYEHTAEALSFLSDVDGQVFSFEVHQIKPEPEIYQLLLKRYGLKAEESVFLDDTLKNVEAAEEQGIHGIHFLTKEQAEEELRKLGVDC